MEDLAVTAPPKKKWKLDGVVLMMLLALLCVGITGAMAVRDMLQ
jgi:hypothetical protein